MNFKRIMITSMYLLIYIGSLNGKINVIKDETITESTQSSIQIGNLDKQEPPSFSDSISSNIIIEQEKESVSDNSFNNEIIENNIKKKIKVYINPSVQKNNMYSCNLGSEAKNMQDIANRMKNILISYSFIELYVNDGSKSLYESCKESNEYKTDIHLALHSNAGGGKGSEIYYIKEKHFANEIYDNYTMLNSFPKRGVKLGSSLYELKTVKAKYASLFELQFHDNEIEAKWIVNNKDIIARNLSESIKNYSLILLKNM